MRFTLLALALVLICPGCSWIYDTGGLRHRDGGVDDSSTADADITDGALEDSGAGDSGPEDASPRDAGGDAGCTDRDTAPNAGSVSWDAHGMLRVSFAGSVTRDVRYQLAIGDATQEFTLVADTMTADVLYFAPLFRTSDDLTITSLDPCAGTPGTFTVPTTLDYLVDGSTSVDAAGGTPSVDISNTGSVVFASKTPLGTETGGGNRVYEWPAGGSPSARFTAVSAPGSDSIVSVRISDDGSLITYWIGNTADKGTYHYILGANTGTIGDPTGYLTSDLRNAVGASPSYLFAMTAGSPSTAVLSASFASAALSSDPITLGQVSDAASAARVPTISPLPAGGYVVAYVQDSPGTPMLWNSTTTAITAATGCTLDSAVGLVTVGSAGQMAFVGTCGSSAGLQIRDPSESTSEFHDVGTVNGLLASDDMQQTFLLRTYSGDTGSFRIGSRTAPASEWSMKPLSTDVSGGVPAATRSALLDAAALSPDGRWAVFAAENAAGNFKLVRIRVH